MVGVVAEAAVAAALVAVGDEAEDGVRDHLKTFYLMLGEMRYQRGFSIQTVLSSCLRSSLL